MSEDAFILRNDSPDQAGPEFENNDGVQRVLFTGLNCLPGQEDLFPTDGGADEPHCHDQDRSA